MLRDQFAALLYKDVTLARLKYYLNLGKKLNWTEQKQETWEISD